MNIYEICTCIWMLFMILGTLLILWLKGQKHTHDLWTFFSYLKTKFSREVTKREERTLNLATSLLSLMIWLICFRVEQLWRVFVWYLILHKKSSELGICLFIFLCLITAHTVLQVVQIENTKIEKNLEYF